MRIKNILYKLFYLTFRYTNILDYFFWRKSFEIQVWLEAYDVVNYWILSRYSTLTNKDDGESLEWRLRLHDCMGEIFVENFDEYTYGERVSILKNEFRNIGAHSHYSYIYTHLVQPIFDCNGIDNEEIGKQVAKDLAKEISNIEEFLANPNLGSSKTYAFEV